MSSRVSTSAVFEFVPASLPVTFLVGLRAILRNTRGTPLLKGLDEMNDLAAAVLTLTAFWLLGRKQRDRP